MSDQYTTLHMIVRGDNIEETSLGYILRDDRATVKTLQTGVYPVLNLLYVALIFVEIEPLDAEEVLEHLPNTLYECWAVEASPVAIHRITLADGQRLVYVQSLDCHKNFLFQDSHASFHGIGGRKSGKWKQESETV